MHGTRNGLGVRAQCPNTPEFGGSPGLPAAVAPGGALGTFSTDNSFLKIFQPGEDAHA